MRESVQDKSRELPSCCRAGAESGGGGGRGGRWKEEEEEEEGKRLSFFYGVREKSFSCGASPRLFGRFRTGTGYKKNRHTSLLSRRERARESHGWVLDATGRVEKKELKGKK